jgi:hypothetical protein
MTNQKDVSEPCGFPDCPATQPHAHCSGQGCIVALGEENDCGDCARLMDAFEADRYREEARREWLTEL